MSNLNIGIRGALLSVLGIIGLSACLNNDEVDIQTNEPIIDVTVESNTSAIVKDVKSASLPQISSSILSVGKREFEASYDGDFEQFACKALDNALTDIPSDIDVIVTPNQEDSFKAFRRDTFLYALRKQDLPFLVWEDVPIESRKKANFSTIATPGRVFSQRSKDKPSTYDTKFRFFKQPMYRDGRGGGVDYIPLSHTYLQQGDRPFSQVKVHRLNDLHSLYQVDVNLDDTLLPNSVRGDALFYGDTFYIRGPFLMLNYPFELGDADFPIARSLVGNNLLELIRVDQYLYAISLDDRTRYETWRYLSLKVIRFDINEFATQDVVAANAVLRKTGKYERRQNPLGAPIELCEITLKLK